MGPMLMTPITDNPTAFAIASAIKVLAFFGVYLVTVAMLTLAERKVSAWIQDRHGPNRAGPGGRYAIWPGAQLDPGEEEADHRALDQDRLKLRAENVRDAGDRLVQDCTMHGALPSRVPQLM